MTSTPRPFSRAGFWAVAKNAAIDSKKDRLPKLAAEVAFYLVLSGPPVLLAVLGTIGSVTRALGPEAVDQMRQNLENAASTLFSPTTMPTVSSLIERFLSSSQVGAISFGIIAALWSSSRAFNAFLDAVRIAYDKPETKPGWKQRLISLGFTAALVAGLALLLPLLIAGPRIALTIGRPLGLGTELATLVRAFYWPTVGAFGVLFLATIYHYAPGKHSSWRRDFPGAIVALVGWVGAAVALRIYTQFAFSNEQLYGPLAAPLILLLWIWWTAIALLAGAEVNSEIDKLWPERALEPPSSPFD